MKYYKVNTSKNFEGTEPFIINSYILQKVQDQDNEHLKSDNNPNL